MYTTIVQKILPLLVAAVALLNLSTARLHFNNRIFPTTDLLSSGSSSGYSYEQRDGHPVSYVHYSSQLEDAYPVYENPVSHPAHSPLPLAPYYTQYATHHPPQQPYPHQPAPHYHVVPEIELDCSSEEEEEGGSQQHLANEALSAERARQGYANQQAFEAEEAGNLDSGHQEGHYKDEAGHAGGHEHSDAEHEIHADEEAAHEGGSHGGGSFHRKGEKTTGYHKVYRKDEFKKDREFYDEAHDGGQYERYGANDAKHANDEGRRVEGAAHQSGHERVAKGSKGYKDAGKEHLEHNAHEAEAGEDAHSREKQEHASRAAQNSGSHHGSHHGLLRYRR